MAEVHGAHVTVMVAPAALLVVTCSPPAPGETADVKETVPTVDPAV